ncbi:hypothetical protein FLAG1_08028 [Fusarium langsethiae]|uniref:Uncharacterized protein n=1 Tax=Fusarium langsethiae TaxID=179993 RepID=A0A0N0DD40_FUSLA|nr:hypothetical protein FLAG1_08028 [Fusarium langsethiae]GKU06848.1 unnamed protein product [Fusarium langsethiae]GKU22749.1 unnamed protein product [Fusarium langsethiae]
MADGSPPQVLPQRRHDLDVAKQQLVCIVTIIATLFVLCPERYQLYRNLAVIPLLAYVTSRTFDLIISLNEKWDRAPAVVKYFVPVQIPEIAPPSEQICRLVNSQIVTASDKVHQFSLQLRSIVHALVDWILRQTGQGSFSKGSPGSDAKTPKQPKPDRWVAVLVTTPILEERNPFQIDTDVNTEILELISWESTELSPNLAIILSSTFKVQLTLCLIPKSIWFSRKTLLEKFMTGLYWSHQPGQSHCQGQQWDEDKIRAISRIQYIGQVEDHKDFFKVNERYDALRKGWNDVNTYWNDVDYAILFAFLLVGKSSTDICKKMFDHFANLRVEYAQRNTDLNRSRAGAALLTLLTGGLAAPVTIPMMMGAGDAAMTMSANDRYLWGERMNMCKGLLERYKELAAIIELKDIEINVSKPVALPPALEKSWFADDTW